MPPKKNLKSRRRASFTGIKFGVGNTLEDFFGTEGIAIFIMLITFGVIIAWITGDSKEREDRTILNRLGMDFSKLFGKK